MKLLVLGGTGFVGRHIVEAALAANHSLTCLNRNQTSPNLFPDVEQIVADRDADLAALQNRQWDVVIDCNCYLTEWVETTCRILQGNVGHYLFISTGSVYAPQQGQTFVDEDCPLQSTENLGQEYWNADYGGLKIRCEQIVEQYFPDRFTILRLGVVAGPQDPTDRITYWVDRIARGGNVLVPANPEAIINAIDVEDLAHFSLHLIQTGQGGVFNAGGPQLTWREWITACQQVYDQACTIIWVDRPAIAEWEEAQAEVRPFGLLPMVPFTSKKPMLYSSEKAVAAGLMFSPLENTLGRIYRWHRQRTMVEPSSAYCEKTLRKALDWGPGSQQYSWMAGMSAETEADLLQFCKAKGLC